MAKFLDINLSKKKNSQGIEFNAKILPQIDWNQFGLHTENHTNTIKSNKSAAVYI